MITIHLIPQAHLDPIWLWPWTAGLCPDTFGVDVSPHEIRLTLLRSPILARHEPNRGTAPRRHHADRGEHSLRFRFFMGDPIDPAGFASSARSLHQPPLLADLTRGMPARPTRGQK